VVEGNIHPTGSPLLYISFQALCRILKGNELRFTDYRKRAKHRMMAVINARKQKDRVAAYKYLLKVTLKTVGDAQRGIERLEGLGDLKAMVSRLELKRFVSLAIRVMDQTCRRVFEGQTVPAAEKVVSIFEPQTDVIFKFWRQSYLGHNLCLTVAPL
jgi:IS5 family transposase